jgi:hypothetical protein
MGGGETSGVREAVFFLLRRVALKRERFCGAMGSQILVTFRVDL